MKCKSHLLLIVVSWVVLVEIGESEEDLKRSRAVLSV